MSNKARNGNSGKNALRKSDLWIAESFSLKQPMRQSDWKLHRAEPSETNKFLALADVALGSHRPEKGKKKRNTLKRAV